MEASRFSQQPDEHDQSMDLNDPSNDPMLDDPGLQKSDINFILEGMLLHQIISILAPCFHRTKIRQNSESDSCSLEAPSSSSAHEMEICSPSESVPQVVGARAHSVPVIDFDFIISEIEKRTGFCDAILEI